MSEPLKAPVLVNALAEYGTPTQIFSGDGTALFFFQSGQPGLVYAVFGPNDYATDPTYWDSATSFPVPPEGVVWKLSPWTKYVAVYDGGGSSYLTYYQQGVTNITT